MPSTPRNPSRTRIATVRFEPAEYARLEAAAEARGLSLSEIIRRNSLGRVIPEPRTPQMDREVITELRRIGTLLNQSVHAFNRWAQAAKAEDRQKRWTEWRQRIEALSGTLDMIAQRLR